MLAAGKASGYSPPREIVEEDNGFIDEISVSEALTTEVGLGGEVAVAIEQKNETERIEAPETGEIQEEKGKVVEMPWWMAVIIASGVGTAACMRRRN